MTLINLHLPLANTREALQNIIGPYHKQKQLYHKNSSLKSQHFKFFMIFTGHEYLYPLLQIPAFLPVRALVPTQNNLIVILTYC